MTRNQRAAALGVFLVRKIVKVKEKMMKKSRSPNDEARHFKHADLRNDTVKFTHPSYI